MDHTHDGRRRGGARLFYLLAALLMAAFTAIGFGLFYTRGMAYPGRPIAPPIHALVVAHGVAMTGWIVLLVVQPLLILVRKRRVHMAVGRAGAVLAAAIVVLGLWLAIRSATVTPPEALIWGVHPKTFMAVPFISILLFGGLVAAGIAYRRKPEIHRTLMILATLCALPAAVSRIDAFNHLYVGTVWERLFGPFLATMVLSVLLLAARSAMARSFDRLFAIGVALLAVVSYATWQVAPTAMWAHIAALFVH